MSYQNILVAVDISDESDHIMNVAKGLMDQGGATISIVTVITPLTGFYVDLYSTLGDVKGIESHAVKTAEASLSELASRHGVSTKSVEVIMGTPATEIKELAESRGVDVIVLGTHGQHGLGLMLGSTANAVLHGAHCDVLAVRVGKEDSAK